MDAAAKLARGLAEALRAEATGHHFYSMAAHTTQDPKGREIFLRLAAEELAHQRYLEATYAGLQEGRGLRGAAKLPPPLALEGPSPIFSTSLRDRLGQAHYEMTALSVGIQLELSSMQHYRAMAEAAADDDERAFFTELADWEAKHYRGLLAQQQELQQDYWSTCGFAPF